MVLFCDQLGIIAVMTQTHNIEPLMQHLRASAAQLGLAHVSVSQPDLSTAREAHLNWLAQGMHGEMSYMARNIEGRFAIDGLVPDALSIISVSLPYLAPQLEADWQNQAWRTMQTPQRASVSRYALGRDYHKVMRGKLQKLGQALSEYVAPFQLQYRVFSDSAPVPEVEIAQQSALGWRGKHTLLLNRSQGSMFFLGELYVNLDLPIDAPASPHCGSCTSCMDICPTRAIVAPYQVDARRCISYLTIEFSGQIPHEFRRAIGNRIYGCDDCQLVCPWNKFATRSDCADFEARHDLHQSDLIDLLAWDESAFKTRMAGSAIHRIGHAQWQRNIILALGNCQKSAEIAAALQPFCQHDNDVLREQAQWSVAQHI